MTEATPLDIYTSRSRCHDIVASIRVMATSCRSSSTEDRRSYDAITLVSPPLMSCSYLSDSNETPKRSTIDA